ncbi:MAG: PLP-dependent aspartate aminotransferase family protein [Treponemataceae bacterium]|nr:PLP-dependent aspartate aminotransferase family protein [Treponemataceae bacterium]
MPLSLETKCVHLKRTETDGCSHYGSVSFPIYQTATYAHPGVGESTGFDYSRLQNPTRDQLEKVVCQLESGIDAFAMASGMAAVSLVMEMFVPGDHIIVDSDLYGGSIRLFDHVSAKNGISFTRVNTSAASLSELEQLVTPQTKAVYIETPTNPMMNITDIAQLASFAKSHNLLFIVDNTFMSPYFQNPLLLGADIVIHSGTKYLSGHNDTLAGFVVTNSPAIQEKLRFLIKTTGAGLSPFDSWLTLRGIKTLSVRMERAQENAKKIVDWLKNQDCVTDVIYPGLPEHPGYEVQKRQARGFGAMVTFNVTDDAKAKSVLNRVRLIQFAESLGGVETLITYPVTQTHADVPEEIREKNGITNRTLRLSVGIENFEDLIEDLAQAMTI